MPPSLPRRAALAALPTFALAPSLLAAPPPPTPIASAPPLPPFPRTHPTLARDTVGAAHRDLERVKALVEARPTLANAAWDWGFGDWETPLGAASHTGQRAIADYLLSKGARLDIFCAAALGHLDALKAILAANPGLQRTRGPHGITLLAHARAGGDAAAPAAAYLEFLGDADPAQTSLPLSRADRQRYLGSYATAPGQAPGVPLTFDIVEARAALALKPTGVFEGSNLALFRTADHEFHPTGAPAVRLRFSFPDPAAAHPTTLTIHDADTTLTAHRL